MLRLVYLRAPMVFIVAALFTGCLPTDPTTAEDAVTVESETVEFAETLPAPESSPTSPNRVTMEAATVSPIKIPTPTPGPTIISVLKETYRQGETVEFIIANPLTSTIYYSYGCGWQMPVYVRGDERFNITVNIAEGTPGVFELMPGESDTCTWDQQAYQQPSQGIPGRFRSAFERVPVPPGHYQFRLNYAFTEEEVPPRLSDQAFTVYSEVFTIE